MSTVLISCGTLEDELRKVVSVVEKNAGIPPRLIFTEPALHDKPTDQMKDVLQKELDALEPEVDLVLFGYGLCGGAIKGLVTGNFTLIVPRVDDCIPLFFGSREKFVEASKVPSFFLTGGWIKFTNKYFYDTLSRLGEKKTAKVYKMMLANYKRFLFIDTGAYDLAKARCDMEDRINRHGLAAETTPGDISWLERLVTGPWPEEDFITVPPHSRICIDNNLG